MRSEIAPLLIVTRLQEFDYAGAAAIGVAMLRGARCAGAQRAHRPPAPAGSAARDAARCCMRPGARHRGRPVPLPLGTVFTEASAMASPLRPPHWPSRMRSPPSA